LLRLSGKALRAGVGGAAEGTECQDNNSNVRTRHSCVSKNL
jgi:hypothetical protein